MEILRKIGKFFGSFFFTIFLFLFLLSYSLANFTQKENLLKAFDQILNSPLIQKFMPNISESQLQSLQLYLKEECKNKERIEVSFGDQNISLECKELQNLTAQETFQVIFRKSARNKFEELYEKSYECKLIECFKIPTFFISFQFHQFLTSLVLPLGLLSLATLSLTWLCSKNWYERLKNTGISLTLVGIAYFFKYLAVYLVPALPFFKEFLVAVPMVSPVFSIFFYALLAGVGLLLTTLIIKLKASKKRKRRKKI